MVRVGLWGPEPLPGAHPQRGAGATARWGYPGGGRRAQEEELPPLHTLDSFSPNPSQLEGREISGGGLEYGHKSGSCFYWCFYFRVSVWKNTFLCIAGTAVLTETRDNAKKKKKKRGMWFSDPGEGRRNPNKLLLVSSPFITFKLNLNSDFTYSLPLHWPRWARSSRAAPGHPEGGGTGESHPGCRERDAGIPVRVAAGTQSLLFAC